MPRYEDMDWTGTKNFSRESFAKLMEVDTELWKQELLSHEELFERMYDKLPKEFLFMMKYHKPFKGRRRNTRIFRISGTS